MPLAYRRGQIQILSSDAVTPLTSGTRSGSFPSTASPGQIMVLAGVAGQPDIVYQYIKNSSDVWVWTEVTRGT